MTFFTDEPKSVFSNVAKVGPWKTRKINLWAIARSFISQVCSTPHAFLFVINDNGYILHAVEAWPRANKDFIACRAMPSLLNVGSDVLPRADSISGVIWHQ